MNTPTTVAPVRSTIPIRAAQRSRCSRRSRRLILLAAAATLLGVCPLTPGPARAVTDTGPRPVPITSAGDVAGIPASVDLRDEAEALTESECVAQVRQSAGEQGEITVGGPRSVYTWASGLLNGSQPSAQPVNIGDWIAAVPSGGKPVGPLEVVHDKGYVTCTPVFNDDLATDIDQIDGACLVHDRNANAWYSLDGTTVTAMGEAATRRLAGPIELRDYGEILRERAGLKPKTSITQGEERPTTGGWVVWGSALAVVVIGIVTVIITVRHERRVTTPLRQARNRADMAERVDRPSRDKSDTQGAAIRRGIPRAAINLFLLGDGAGDDVDAIAGETLGDTISENRVNLPRNLRAQASPVRIPSIGSSPGTQVAVVDAAPPATGACVPQVLSQDEQADTRRHVEPLGQMLSRTLSAPEVAECSLDVVVATTGPTPFTGLWAGLVTAGVVGCTRGVPVREVFSLDTVARRALGEPGVQEGQTGPIVLVATDARRCEVYTALFRANGPDDVIRLTEIIICSLTQVVQRLAEQAPGPGRGSGGIGVVVGSGVSLYPEPVDMASCQKVLVPVPGSALTQVRIALTRLERSEELSTQSLYLRHADVQMSAGRKRVR